MSLPLNQSKTMQLYYYDSCPFCVKTRKAIAQSDVSVELRNIQHNNQYRLDLINGGGKKQVPCLRIEHATDDIQWLYESSDIIKFLM